ncbi:MAG: hypothetical protein RXR08_11590 [Sulfolobaceae archaeon]
MSSGYLSRIFLGISLVVVIFFILWRLEFTAYRKLPARAEKLRYLYTEPFDVKHFSKKRCNGYIASYTGL